MPRADRASAREMVGYWDGIGDAWTKQHLDPVWRMHSDAVYAALLERWLPAKKLRRILKTDLFDEAVAEGLYPVVQARAERVTGFDVSPRIAAAACARYPSLEGIVADARCSIGALSSKRSQRSMEKMCPCRRLNRPSRKRGLDSHRHWCQSACRAATSSRTTMVRRAIPTVSTPRDAVTQDAGRAL